MCGCYYKIAENQHHSNFSLFVISECNPPTPILYGNLTMSEDNQTVTYTCEVGRTLVGPSNRECQVDGTGWSSSEPSCGKY